MAKNTHPQPNSPSTRLNHSIRDCVNFRLSEKPFNPNWSLIEQLKKVTKTKKRHLALAVIRGAFLWGYRVRHSLSRTSNVGKDQRRPRTLGVRRNL